MPTYQGDDGAELYYDVLGESSAPPLMVLAGGAGRHPDYLGDLAGLSEHYQLLVPHLRGVGRSATADVAVMGSRWRQAEDLERLRTTLDLQQCAVVGHSAGTRLAIAYAARFADRLSTLLLITPPAWYLVDVPDDTEALAAGRMADPAFAAAVAAQEAGPDTSSDETFAEWMRATAPVGYATWGDAAQRDAAVGGYWLAANRAFLSGDIPADLASRLREVTAPTLLVAGAQDAIAGVDAVVALAELFPHGRAAVIQDCGHFPWFEQPAAFRDLVDPFLHQSDSTAAAAPPD
ncbi:MAG: alpha/beta fold hydrolase [Nakamurella sp.]